MLLLFLDPRCCKENDARLFFTLLSLLFLLFSPKTWVSNWSHLLLTVGFSSVLRGPLWADQPEKLEPGLRRSAQNTLSPSVHASAPLPKETEVEWVSNLTCSVNEGVHLA